MNINISKYQSDIRTALADNGWEVAEVEEPDAWWCHESWRLRSLWAPNGAEVFLAFVIDPMADSEQLQLGRYEVWAVKASPAIAMNAAAGPLDFFLTLGGKWQQRIPGLIGHLGRLRNMHSDSAR